MNETKAREILKNAICPNNGLDNMGRYMSWHPKFPTEITLDGDFGPEELEAIAWWMQNKKEK